MAADVRERQAPLALIALGSALLVVAAFTRHGANGVAPVMLAVTVAAVVQTVLLVAAAFVVAALMSVSFGEVPSAILKFAAATLVASAVGAFIPLIGLFVFLGLIVWLFEIELIYAIVLTVVYVVISFIVGLVLAGLVR